MMDYNTVGLVGFSNLVILAFIVLWRWICHWLDNSAKNNCKKHTTFFLLLFAPLCDLPMYVSFFVLRKYDLFTFSFHKFKAAALFGAYSLTISDWNSVLYEIQEESRIPFLCRNISLIATNLVLTMISLLNFAYCYSFPDLDTYANSKVYVLGVFISIIAPLVLTVGMLWAGLKLSWRIQGASGSLKFSTENAKLKEFRSAVFHINIVMISVCVTILIQVTLLILNYYYGYHSDPDKSIGPELFFWTFCEWLPVWVLTLAQLYLLRSNANIRARSVSGPKYKKRRGANTIKEDVATGNHAGEGGSSESANHNVGGTPGSNKSNKKIKGKRNKSVKVSKLPAVDEESEVVSCMTEEEEQDGDDEDGNDGNAPDMTEPLLPSQQRMSLTGSMQSMVNSDYVRRDTYNGDLEDSRTFDQSSVSAVFMSPQAALFSDYSMSQSDFLAQVRLSHYPMTSNTSIPPTSTPPPTTVNPV